MKGVLKALQVSKEQLVINEGCLKSCGLLLERFLSAGATLGMIMMREVPVPLTGRKTALM